MKKLASILAITAVVANLGIAAVYAVDADPMTTEGTQTIGCATEAEPTLSATDAATFQQRYTNFYNSTDSQLTSNLVVSFQDTRGYDPDGVGRCGNGYIVTIASPGLTLGTGTDPLDMVYDHTVDVGDCARCDGGDVITEMTDSGSISTAKNLFETTEAFLGTYTLTLPMETTALVVDSASVAGPIAQGAYTGVITFDATEVVI